MLTTHLSQVETDKKQQIIIRELLLSGLWVLFPLINRFGFFQGKFIFDFETQENLGKALGVSRECINRTIQFMVRIGILKIKKVRRVWVEWLRDASGKKFKKIIKNQWLHNEYRLLPIMFTQEVVEALEGKTTHHHFDTYVNPRFILGNSSYNKYNYNFYSSSITLIESTSSSLPWSTQKNSESEEIGHPKMSKSEFYAILVI